MPKLVVIASLVVSAFGPAATPAPAPTKPPAQPTRAPEPTKVPPTATKPPEPTKVSTPTIPPTVVAGGVGCAAGSTTFVWCIGLGAGTQPDDVTKEKAKVDKFNKASFQGAWADVSQLAKDAGFDPSKYDPALLDFTKNAQSGWINLSLKAIGVANPPRWFTDPTWAITALNHLHMDASEVSCRLDLFSAPWQ